MNPKNVQRAMTSALSMVLLSLGVALLPVQAVAQDYPTKPITLIVPYAPGGATDTIGRVVADSLAKQFGKPVIVENKGGAASNIGANYVAHQKPDGYTLLVATDPALFLNEFVYKELPFSPEKDFDPVTHVMNVHSILVVAPSLGVKTLEAFVAKMKAEGAKYNYGSPGVGDGSHLGMEWLKNEAGGFAMTHIPYNGMGPTVQGMLSGDHQALIVSVVTAKPYIDAGNMIPIAVSGTRRAPGLPDVPTFAELGYPTIRLGFALGLMAPKGTPIAIRRKIADALQEAFKDETFQAKYVTGLGYEALASSPEEFQKFLGSARQDAARVVKLAGAEKQQ
ncbi:Bug family tripartite tricarboxylate transporter substrate binding protein [Chelatococcus asaccharovorans]|uniref:Tripartite-type tricarboxylate transporter receptor subunit TctC n=1 Tax=Chelatococcus asaccharovorans TaxID=28210 RepID=A0A2V3TX21_9HYPH|nr:tripartite tricarboxylate transporter substrate binding protein [Chelatococcus asaccharovorans]MBS7707473.1 tripartite tricarboxylate transporter substrate binding protein [Chelatococcus asaccharovorans]PXW54207.1 tripartite-type tricarboxylate transporter receptor subunit TctC [Chelatococcus asaccharovorans]